MRNRFTLFLMLMLLMGTGMNAQTVVAKMKALAEAAGNSDTKATVSTVWQSDKEGGAVYEFSNGKYLGAISNKAVVDALEGDKYVTIAMWVYGRTTGYQCLFGYGNGNDGVKFQQNGKSISATKKSVREIGGWSRDELLDDEWNLIAFAVAGKANTTAEKGKYYINDINANQDGLKLSGMATTADENKLLAIGSGNRDKGKRPIMAKESALRSDRLVLTSDNPRFEEPEEIIKDMQAGLDSDDLREKTISITDRREAIRTAMMIAEKGDVILIAGKGHEDYQDIKGTKHHFDDHEVVREAMGI